MDVSTRTIFLMKNSHLHTSNIHALSIPLDTGSRVYFLSADSGSRSKGERVCLRGGVEVGPIVRLDTIASRRSDSTF